jgi:hypothetical protein
LSRKLLFEPGRARARQGRPENTPYLMARMVLNTAEKVKRDK